MIFKFSSSKYQIFHTHWILKGVVSTFHNKTIAYFVYLCIIVLHLIDSKFLKNQILWFYSKEYVYRDRLQKSIIVFML